MTQSNKIGETKVIETELKIKRYIKLKIAPHDVTKAHKTMLRKYKALSIEHKAEFIVDLDKEIKKLRAQ